MWYQIIFMEKLQLRSPRDIWKFSIVCSLSPRVVHMMKKKICSILSGRRDRNGWLHKHVRYFLGIFSSKKKPYVCEFNSNFSAHGRTARIQQRAIQILSTIRNSLEIPNARPFNGTTRRMPDSPQAPKPGYPWIQIMSTLIWKHRSQQVGVISNSIRNSWS